MVDVYMTPVPLLADLGPQELILILLVCVLLFGAKKLPDLARGSGRALRIFKAEMQGFETDDASPRADTADTPNTPGTGRSAASAAASAASSTAAGGDLTARLAALDAEQAALDAERRRLLES